MSNARKKKLKKLKSMEVKNARSPASSSSETRKKSEWIGQQLRSIYEETLAEPVPDRFTELLRQLDEKAGKKK